MVRVSHKDKNNSKPLYFMSKDSLETKASRKKNILLISKGRSSKSKDGTQPSPGIILMLPKPKSTKGKIFLHVLQITRKGPIQIQSFNTRAEMIEKANINGFKYCILNENDSLVELPPKAMKILMEFHRAVKISHCGQDKYFSPSDAPTEFDAAIQFFGRNVYKVFFCRGRAALRETAKLWNDLDGYRSVEVISAVEKQILMLFPDGSGGPPLSKRN